MHNKPKKQALLTKSKKFKQKQQRSRFTKYLLLLIILLFVGGIFIFIKMKNNNNTKTLFLGNNEIDLNGVDVSNIKTLHTNESIIKPLTDTRTYEIIQLTNQLAITLISDVNAERSGFSLTTFLGERNKMIKYPGSANWIRSKLLSTNKELQSVFDAGFAVIKTHTELEYTNYYFDINSQHFTNALYIIGNILNDIKRVLLTDKTKQTIAQELQDILSSTNELHVENLLIDYLLCKECYHYSEDYSNVNDIILNIENLLDIFYSPKNIKIAIISNQDITTLKQIVHVSFDKLINSNLSIKPEHTIEVSDLYQLVPLSKISFHQFIWHKPKQETHLKILKLILFSGEYQLKGLTQLSYFIYMLSGERPGSLSNDLKKRQLITNMNVYIEKTLSYGNRLVIEYELTKSGYEYLDNLVVLSFNYFKTFNDILSTYNDFRAIHQKKFLYMTIDKYSSYLNDISFNMVDYNKLNEVLYMNYDVESVASKVYNYMSNLKIQYATMVLYAYDDIDPMNHLFGLFSEDRVDILKNAKTNMRTYLGLNYLALPYEHEGIEQRMHVSFHWDKSSFLPKSRNNYLTKLTSLASSPHETGPISTLISKENSINILYQKDTTFLVPRVHSYFHLIYPQMRTNDKAQHKLNLKAINHIMIDIDMEFEEARMSGNDINLDMDENGINIKLSCYKDVYLPIFLKLFTFIYDRTQIREFTSIDYETKHYRNKQDKANTILGSVVKPDINGNYNKNEQTFVVGSEIINYIGTIAMNSYIEGLLYGDVDDTLIDSLTEHLKAFDNGNRIRKGLIDTYRDVINDKSMNGIFEYLRFNKEIPDNNVHVFRLNEVYWEVDHNYMIMFYQIGKRTNAHDVYCDLICYRFNKMINRNYKFEMKKIFKDDYIYLLIMIDSFNEKIDHVVQKVNDEIDSFTKNDIKITDVDFELMMNYVKRDYFKKPTRLRYKAIKVWYELYEKTYDYSRYDKLKQMIEDKMKKMSNTKKEYIEYIKTVFVDKVKRIEFQFNAYQSDNALPVPSKEQLHYGKNINIIYHNQYELI